MCSHCQPLKDAELLLARLAAHAPERPIFTTCIGVRRVVRPLSAVHGRAGDWGVAMGADSRSATAFDPTPDIFNTRDDRVAQHLRRDQLVMPVDSELDGLAALEIVSACVSCRTSYRTTN